VVFSGYSIRKRPTEKGQVKIHTALFTEKIEAHEPHSGKSRIGDREKKQIYVQGKRPICEIDIS
jgi:hypothetical protein